MCPGFALDRLSPDSSGSIATSLAASRHRSDTVRRRPSSSKMQTSFRLRPSNARTRSRAVLRLQDGRRFGDAGPGSTVNFMDRSSPSCSKRKPRAVEFDAGRGHSACWRTSARTKNLRLLYGHGQQDIKVEAAKARQVALARLSVRAGQRPVCPKAIIAMPSLAKQL